jgi:UPF0755 protein
VVRARHRGADEHARPAGGGGPLPPPDDRSSGGHPSAPLPPFPPSAWSKLASRREAPAGEDTVAGSGPVPEDTQAAPLPPSVPEAHAGGRDDDAWYDAREHDAGHAPGEAWDERGAGDWDATGGLDVIGHHVDGDPAGDADVTDVHPRALDDLDDPATDDLDLIGDDDRSDDAAGLPLDDDVPLSTGESSHGRRRRRRRRVALAVSLVVLAGLALGIVFGGRQVLDLVNPPDFTGAGTGSVQIRVQDGDTLKTIGQTMVDSGVIASVRPFVKAAEGTPQATSISPGTYALRHHMSGRAALDLLLQPGSRLTSRVTLPEGITVAVTLQKLARGTGTPLAQLQAAVADPATLGLPAYAGGKVEGFLFPATYDFEPGTTPVQMLQAMVDRTSKTLDDLAVPAAQRLQVLTEASIVQAEGKTPDDMAKIARVLVNRLASGMPLQLDTTVNYANGKNGVTTTAQDRANPSPYNTYAHPGLPPGPIGNPGEDAIRAVLAPAQGSWLYFVVVNPDTGETRFATTPQEAQANTALFQQWLREHPGR